MAGQQEPSNSSGAWLGWLVAAGIAFVVIKSCSATSPTSQSLVSNPDPNSIATSAAAPPTIQLPDVDATSVSRGTSHLKVALDAEGFPGAMIYSQNCFASLNQNFSWAKLDQCEAFDALAELAISQSAQDGTEATYFAKDTVDQRFTKVASDRQADPSSAQSHLSTLTSAALARIADLQSQDATAQSLAADATSGQNDEESSSANGVGAETSEPTDATPTTSGTAYQAPTYSYVPSAPSSSSAPTPSCSESGSCYGDVSNVTGLPKTTYVHGYFRKNGTYVRSYYRSHR